ncbi:MAG TPA: YdcF family protein [Streptosporangiaceae bacterium]
MTVETIEGPGGVSLRDLAHVLVPGRGRDGSGTGLTADARDRVATARMLYDLAVRPNGGRIVCSGYKSPADTKGENWSPADAPGEVFRGMPEADIMRTELVRLGVPEGDVYAERHSIDTVTNFLRSEREGWFGDARPVAIVAQRSHLRRMLRVIAPRTLRRSYLGVVVPEAGERSENPLASLVSACILTGLPVADQRAIDVSERRAEWFWRAAWLAGVRHYH